MHGDAPQSALGVRESFPGKQAKEYFCTGVSYYAPKWYVSFKSPGTDDQAFGPAFQQPGHFKDVIAQVLTIGVRVDNADKAVKVRAGVMEPRLEGRSFSEISGVFEQDYAPGHLQLLKNGAATLVAAIIYDDDGFDICGSKPLHKANKFLRRIVSRYEYRYIHPIPQYRALHR